MSLLHSLDGRKVKMREAERGDCSLQSTSEARRRKSGSQKVGKKRGDRISFLCGWGGILAGGVTRK